MDLQPYVENLQQQVVVAAATGGDDARALVERLLSPLDAAIRLTLQDALVAAVEEITRELAPGAVEVRLRGRDPEFVVTAPVAETSADDFSAPDDVRAQRQAALGSPDADDGAMTRINLRLPDLLKGRVEQAAGGEGLSVNSWLVRAASAALERPGPGPRTETRAPRSGQRYTGWAR